MIHDTAAVALELPLRSRYVRRALPASRVASSMQAAIVIFPGSNRERDVVDALHRCAGTKPLTVWHRDSTLPDVDLIVIPGGFAYGDYLRCGAMAAHSPIMREVKARAAAGVPVLGICNGFQVLTEAGMLPGALLANQTLRFHCKDVHLRVEASDSIFTARLSRRRGDPRAGGASRRQLLRRRGDARPARRRGPRRLPLLRARRHRDRRRATTTAPRATSRACSMRRSACSGSCRIPRTRPIRCSARPTDALSSPAWSRPCLERDRAGDRRAARAFRRRIWRAPSPSWAASPTSPSSASSR